jgi:hypothetical protein
MGTCDDSRHGTQNFVMTGVGTHCHVANFADPISVEAVSYGEVEWRLDRRRYLIRMGALAAAVAANASLDTVGSLSRRRAERAVAWFAS